MKKQENLIGKYYRQESRWDDSAERLTFISDLETKTIFKVIGVHNSKEHTEEVLYKLKEIRFQADGIIAWDTTVCSASNLKIRFVELSQAYVEELKKTVMNNIFSNL